jgi:hypothetical protein
VSLLEEEEEEEETELTCCPWRYLTFGYCRQHQDRHCWEMAGETVGRWVVAEKMEALDISGDEVEGWIKEKDQ